MNSFARVLAMTAVLAPGVAAGAESARQLLTRLPRQLQLRQDGPRSYRFICDYLYTEPLGNPLWKERMSAEYTRTSAGGGARWSNVRIARAKGFEEPFPEGEVQPFMEGFEYVLGSAKDTLKPEFFRGFPAADMKPKNLVWDTHMIEDFAWRYFDKLELNRPYALQTAPEDVPLAGAGTFQNRRVELTWTGISKRADRICALIRYEAFGNKFEASAGNVIARGRSHYWGEIWVSLRDKQIEYATLLEDVLTEVSPPGQPAKQLFSVFRKGTFDPLPK